MTRKVLVYMQIYFHEKNELLHVQFKQGHTDLDIYCCMPWKFLWPSFDIDYSFMDGINGDLDSTSSPLDWSCDRLNILIDCIRNETAASSSEVEKLLMSNKLSVYKEFLQVCRSQGKKSHLTLSTTMDTSNQCLVLNYKTL